jgi:hypothetical protein
LSLTVCEEALTDTIIPINKLSIFFFIVVDLSYKFRPVTIKKFKTK